MPITHAFATFHVDADSELRSEAVETFATLEEAEDAADRDADGELYAAEIEETDYEAELADDEFLDDEEAFAFDGLCLCHA